MLTDAAREVLQKVFVIWRMNFELAVDLKTFDISWKKIKKLKLGNFISAAFCDCRLPASQSAVTNTPHYNDLKDKT